MKPLPFDHKLESSILGQCIMDYESFLYCLSIVDKSYFSHPFYITVWEALEELHSDGIEPDVFLLKQTIAKSLKETPQEVTKKLSEICDSVPFPNVENWVVYARNLRNARKFIELCEQYADEALTGKIDDVMDEFHMKFIEIGAGKSGLMIQDASKRIDDAVEKVRTGMNNNGVSGITTGLASWDFISGGLQTGLHVIAGRPGAGKSEISMFVAANAEKQAPGYVAQLEMSSDQTTFRQITSMSGIRYSKMQRSQFTEDEFDKFVAWAETAKTMRMYIDPTSGMSLTQIVSKIKYHHRRFGVKWAIVDYLQIMGNEQGKNQTRDQALGTITRTLKKLANELDIPIVLLAQLGRVTESHPRGRPKVSDIRESGNAENDADTVILLYFAERYKDQYDQFVDEETGYPLDGIIELIFAKNRNGVPDVSVFAHWDRGKINYTDVPVLNRHLGMVNTQPQQQENEDPVF